MTQIWPLKFREIREDQVLFADDAGGWFFSDSSFLARFGTGTLAPDDLNFLEHNGHAFQEQGDYDFKSFSYRWLQRHRPPRDLEYLILVPTLRCDLTCSYCQVSRAAIHSNGHDWTQQTIAEVLRLIDGLNTPRIKVEFQGGEPTLRMDILHRVRDACRAKFQSSEFIVCTNLQTLDEQRLDFFSDQDTFVSTSMDGGKLIQSKNRTHDLSLADNFFLNLATLREKIGSSRLAALPTIDVFDPPDFEELIATYESHGMSSIFLRPISHHGFARRSPQTADRIERWNTIHKAFVLYLIERNWNTKRPVTEFYLSHCLRRVLRAGLDSYVDLRNPAHFGLDHLVIDYDGTLYPSDEARMLARIGHVDLSIGSVGYGIDKAGRTAINFDAFNDFDPDCIHCPYQAFCGGDRIDHIARYGRADIPKAETWFCKKHTAIFDLIFDLLSASDEPTQYSLAHWAGLPEWPTERIVTHR